MKSQTVPRVDRAAFEERGFAIVSDHELRGELDEVEEEVEELGRHIAGPAFSMYGAASKKMGPRTQSSLYDRLKYLPALSRLEGSKRVLALCKQFGLEMPSLMGTSNMRMDLPHDDKHLFAWHQDAVYLLGSVNAVTLWIPFGDVNLHNGTIQVIPGSHKRGIHPFKQISDKAILQYVPMFQRDLALDTEVAEVPETIVAGRGDIVIFKQMLLHRSTANVSDLVRWTVQLRITDLAEPEHMRQNFPTGDRTNIFFVDYPGFKHPLTVPR